MEQKFIDQDDSASQRKSDHITLAMQAQVAEMSLDRRFYYEPILGAHPSAESRASLKFIDHNLDLPIWISSMTGGTTMASSINKNLAQACGDYKLGMGLGSCRSLLTSDERITDFDVRKYIGDQPLYANLGIAQIEKLVSSNKLYLVTELIKKLQASGLIIHINPLQEWLQPEGDLYQSNPLDLIKSVLDICDNVIVKEVGQGMGPGSLQALMQLPLQAIDFGAAGGTNFTYLEMLRTKDGVSPQAPYAYVGHTADEMVGYVNRIIAENSDKILSKSFIISGGVKSFLDGYHLTSKIAATSVYGQAAPFLQAALIGYEEVCSFIEEQKRGFLLAKNILKLRP